MVAEITELWVEISQKINCRGVTSIWKGRVRDIKKGNLKSKSKDQIRAIQNVQIFFDLREKIINFFGDYSILISEAKYKAKYGEGMKGLSPKQML